MTARVSPGVEGALALLADAGQRRYDGEDVSQREHALQAAARAAEAGAPVALQLAALLHDLGHLLLPEGEAAVDRAHERAGAAWLATWLRPEITEPVRLHVAAKRALARDPAYAAALSPASVRSLALQGGPFDDDALQAFLADPHAQDALALRRWDEAAKVPGAPTPPIEAWAPALSGAAALARFAPLLAPLGDPARAAGAKAYLKSPLRHLGATAPALRAAAAQWDRQCPALTEEALLSMADQAFDTGLWEDRLLACLALERRRKAFTPAALPALAGLCARAETWALVDLLAVKVIGPALWKAADPAAALEPLVVDPSVWVRRAALLAPLDRLRAGQGELGLFAGLADRLIADPSFWIQKAIGWVLRDCARKRPAEVGAVVEALGPRLRGLARREAARGLARAAEGSGRSAVPSAAPSP
ncbi:MAG: hypothetical protein RL071_249 [Pseudomonadota bacterium]